ncbi:hypothetical protein KGM_200288 [Danaus plexippus plexippus]|uniref:Uncharacterized protein n=1 Tax=Danaus plexippus plexippus TaxID=278856 RepID=A0A212EPB3_DANPL|nr:hypothetical protein KGM_200288 [Danaus plexippus plexippus]
MAAGARADPAPAPAPPSLIHNNGTKSRELFNYSIAPSVREPPSRQCQCASSREENVQV